MLQYKSLIQYTRLVNQLRFPQNPDEPFALVYFSENSGLIKDFPKLQIRRVDVRHIVLPITKIPVTRLVPDIRSAYKNLGLLPFSSNMNFPKEKNIIVDTSIYTGTIDKIYKPHTYRQRAGFLIQNLLHKTFSLFPDNYKKVLVYSIDKTEALNSFVNRKIFPLLQQLRADEIFFDDLLFVTLDESSAHYRLLISDREYKFSRVLQYLRQVKTINTEEEQDEEVSNVTKTIIAKVAKHIEKPDVVKSAVTDYLKKKPEIVDKADTMSDEDLKRLTIASVLFGASGDLDKAERLSNKIPAKQITKAVSKVTKQYEDELLLKPKSENLSTSVVSQTQNIANVVDNKTPEHIFEKRKIDFETNLKKDMTNAFKVLENRDIPLSFVSISVKDRSQRAGEIQKTDESIVTMTLKDKHNKLQEVNIVIPKIDPSTGTFRINGQRKCLINQIVLNPISFPKPYDSKFESSYSSFHIYSKRTKKLKYLETYMGSFRLPLAILLSYSFGFKESMRQYGISYKIVEEKPGKDEYFTEVPSSYLLFENLNTELKQEVASSFIHAKVNLYNIDKKFLSKEYFNDLIIRMTGRVDSTYLIGNNLQNIVDPIARQVLVNKQLPFELPLIIQYMSSKAVTGFVQERNDITNQRVRNSELLVHLAQKQLLKAYTEYRQQYLAGNKDAKINVPEMKVMSEFIKLELVQNMEYSNPIEEMAAMTKISPVGKDVGGIPDKQGVQLDARNVHPSYFGNIDPLDTAESDNIGINQQLTVNAYITSARGLFGEKPLNNDEKSGILSTTTSMIPFIENNEGARIIMAANQAKQMLPLKNPEAPIVQSGYESLLTNVLSDNFIKRAPCAGKISAITADYIDVMCGGTRKQRIDITPVQLKSGTGKNALSIFRPLVKVGQTVKNRQVIAEGSCVSGGTISLGRNLACGYMPYKGFNFEDGLVISERLVKEDKLTSLHGINVEVDIDSKDRIVFVSELGAETVKGEPLLRKYPGDIDELLGYNQEDDEDVDTYDGQIIIKSPGGRIVDIEVYSNIDDSKFPMLKNLIERTDKKFKKPSKEKYTSRDTTIKGIKVIFKVQQELKIGLGDKLCNRFGNKGIISLIEKEENMPRTPWGEKLDIVLNPLGVISRMNMGQIYEMYCGLISKHVANLIKRGASKADIIKLFTTVASSLDTSKNNKFSSQFVNSFKKLSDAKFKLMVEQIKVSGFTPIIVPPFQGPTYKQILALLKKLKLQTGYHLTLPEYNTKTASKVPFGYLYIAKLEHIGEMKAHARSTGPVTGKIGQPTGGKSREGGQRVGEGDTWALASYNCPTVLSELFGPLSDDTVSKNEIISEIIQTGDAEFRETKVSPTKDLLNAYFTAMMLGG